MWSRLYKTFKTASRWLYMTAVRAGKQALSITTVSDLPLKGESTSSEERQKTFTQMMEVALTVASEAVDGHDK